MKMPTDADDIIEFWNRCPLKGPSFAHPDDQPILDKHSQHIYSGDLQFKNFVTVHQSSKHVCNAVMDRRLHLSLIPIPYIGNLLHADIFILLLNPGFNFIDHYAQIHSDLFRSRLEGNLRQEFDKIDYPFLSLDPDFSWHSGFGWWEGKLRQVIGRIAYEKFEGNYVAALKDVANRIAAIEMVPYHSTSFGGSALLNRLPSVQAAKAYVKNILEPEALAGRRLIIVTRRVSDWGLTEGPNIVHYDGALARGASLSCTSKGGKAILARYGISSRPDA